MRLFKNWHPDEVTLQAAQENCLSGFKKRRVERHVLHCERCQRAQASYQRLNQTLAAMARAQRQEELPELDLFTAQILDNVLSQLPETLPSKASLRERGLLFTGGMVALGMAVLLTLGPTLTDPMASALALGRILTWFIGLAELLLVVVRSFYLVLEPMRNPTLLVGATLLALAAMTMHRRSQLALPR
jgi:hypothetical protein